MTTPSKLTKAENACVDFVRRFAEMQWRDVVDNRVAFQRLDALRDEAIRLSHDWLQAEIDASYASLCQPDESCEWGPWRHDEGGTHRWRSECVRCKATRLSNHQVGT